jgi:hypothetical protein
MTHATTVVSTITFSLSEITEDERQNIANYGTQEFILIQTTKKLIIFRATIYDPNIFTIEAIFRGIKVDHIEY